MPSTIRADDPGERIPEVEGNFLYRAHLRICGARRHLARQAGRKSIEPCRPEVAQRHSGYQVGGTAPFGTRRPLPSYMERSIAELPAVYINGGRRGLLVRIKTEDLLAALKPRLVEVALED